MPYGTRLTIFIVACVLVGGFFLVLFLYGPIRNLYRRHRTVNSYYKMVMKTALDHDFYLINKWSYQFGEGKNEGVHIDHLLFGDKFIYVIRDRYFEGAITAKPDDRSWVYYRGKKNKKYFDNPMAINKIRADRLSYLSGKPREYFVCIVLVNDDCLVTPFKNSEDGNYLVSVSKFEKFIEAKEKADLASFEEEELNAVVKDFASLNGRKRA